MKNARERGRWGTWLRQERLSRGLSPEQVREMLAKRGYRVGESTYAEWESGYKKQPAREAIPHLIALWGSEPAPEPVGATETPDGLAAAIDRQTAAIEKQTLVLDRVLALLEGRASSPAVGRLGAALASIARSPDVMLAEEELTPQDGLPEGASPSGH